MILAECDPSGGDILAGLFAGHLPARNGLLALAIEAGQNPEAVAAALWPQLIELDDERGQAAARRALRPAPEHRAWRRSGRCWRACSRPSPPT